MASQAQTRGGKGEHAAKLTTTKNADCRAGFESVLHDLLRIRRHGVGLRLPKGIEARGEGRIMKGKNGGGQKRGIGRSGRANGQSADGDAFGHLDNGQKRILAGKCGRFYRNAQYWHTGLGGQHTGQVRSAAAFALARLKCKAVLPVLIDGLAAELRRKKDLLVGQFADGKIRFYKNLGAGKLAAGEWLQAEGEVAKVPGVW